MVRYLAIFHRSKADDLDVGALERATGLLRVAQTKHLIVMIESHEQAVDVAKCLCIGTIFGGHEGTKRIQTPATRDIDSAYNGSFEILLKQYWGGYVAFAFGKEKQAILRDPSGFVPCYYTTTRDHVLFSSDAEVLERSGLVSLSVDWVELSRHLASGDLRSTSTCLSGLHEIPNGAQAVVSATGVEITSLWSPWEHASASREPDSILLERLRCTVLGCVEAWASCYGGSIVSVSGGLDSSIVAAALARTSQRPTLFTMATADALGDERRYARVLASSLKCDLVEAFYEDFEVDLAATGRPELPRPVGLPYLSPFFQQLARLQKEKGIDCHFTGNGGDNIFCLMPTATPIVDHVLAGGGISAFNTVRDVCRMTQCSVIDALVQARRTFGRRNMRYRWRADASFLANEHQALDHPWLDAPTKALPGKRAHIAQLLQTQNFVEGPPRRTGSALLAPLLSQPIVELCLSIPTWKWIAGGQDRVVARKAFALDLPPAILNRRSKGSPAGFANDLFEDKREELRDLLLGGVMATEGLLDTSAVNTALHDGAALKNHNFGRLMRLGAAEAWARHWYGTDREMIHRSARLPEISA